MLLYHPKDDTYHCIFRLLSIMHVLNGATVELVKLQIIDFYLLFPTLLSEIQYPRVSGASALKRDAATKNTYERLPDKSRLFSDLRYNQDQAVNILRAKELLQINGDNTVPGSAFDNAEILKIIKAGNYTNDPFYVAAIKALHAIELHGSSGLKARTKLVEARYDAA